MLFCLILIGVIGVNDFAMLEVVRRGRLKKMILAACQISDITLFQIAELCKSQVSIGVIKLVI